MRKCLMFGAMLISASAISEVDRFDMSLLGEFQKDYCELELTNPSPSFELDFTANTPQRHYYSFHNVETGTVASLTCTPGVYQVALLASDGGDMALDEPMDGLSVTPFARLYNDDLYVYDLPLFVWHETWGSEVEIDTYREVARYEFYFDISVHEDLLPIISEKVTGSSELVFVIDKK